MNGIGDGPERAQTIERDSLAPLLLGGPAPESLAELSLVLAGAWIDVAEDVVLLARWRMTDERREVRARIDRRAWRLLREEASS